MNEAENVPALIGALRAFRGEWSCAQLTASYRTPGGLLVTIVVGPDGVVVRDDQGTEIRVRGLS